MRAFLLSVILGIAALGTVAVTPAPVRARDGAEDGFNDATTVPVRWGRGWGWGGYYRPYYRGWGGYGYYPYRSFYYGGYYPGYSSFYYGYGSPGFLWW